MWDVKPLLGSVLLYFLPFRKCKSPRSSLVQRSHNKKDALRRVSACQKSPITIDIVLLRMGGRLCPPGRVQLILRKAAAHTHALPVSVWGSMPIFGAKSRAMRGCASKLACGRRIDPADCTVFTVICGKFATSRRADVGIGPYRVLREFTAAHRADRDVRPYASLGNPTQNRKTIVF